ncbi:AarF/ABC1/UbiB kinase family protein [Moraxella sp. VT-16-12]|uniref:ABC1 kinase family protein n=1 Tax=Moraxella sp. VT-16-12 TaxID=2014877 RepID=UPI000B7CDB3B|nr:AarF/ABC1/UbiB kinase family protein [Moraxella sp. VT-16-12]TWV81565.1 AarF/ABC1/UbiB kinase family protein [Moraxella sp. VT-16-12]
MKKSPINLAKKTLSTGIRVLGRVQKTASVAGLSALRVAKGDTADAQLVRDAFMQMGVTYIKLGQFIASTPSIFPREYVMAFNDCLDKTPPVPYHHIQQVLKDELGERFFELDIDPVPIASASIAQVHKATLKDGRVLALKVQKPDVSAVIATDLEVLHGAFWAMEKLVPSLKAVNLAPIMAEIKQRMLAETDFLAEARHIDEFLAFLKQAGNTAVTAPSVHHDLSTKRLLVMDFLVGKSLVDDSLGLSDEKASHAMSVVLDTWFLSVIMTGQFHADLHAGNLMMLDDGQVAFLDFGLVGQIDPKSLQACFTLVQSLQNQDHLAMANAMIDIGMTKGSGVNAQVLAQDLQKFLDSVHAADPTKQTDGLNVMMMELGQIGKRHGIHFPKDFALLTKQLLYFDRFMLALDPQMELFDGERLQALKTLS